MDRSHLLAVAVLAAAMAPGAVPSARADRLGGNYRGPDDSYVLREDAPPPAEARPKDPLLASLSLDRPFVPGLEEGRREALFRGRPLLVFYVLPGCGRCASVAGGAFRDPAVLDLLSRYVAAAVDAEREELFGVSHGVRTFPTILLLDADGGEAGRAEGAVDADRVAALLREGLRRARPGRPAPDALALEKAARDLARARRAKDWKAVLAAAAAVEAIGHDGPERDGAREARGEAAIEAASRLEAAAGLIEEGRRTGARRILAGVARDFEGLGEAAEAKDLLRGMEGSRPAGGGLRGYFRTIGTQNARVPKATPTLQAETPAPLVDRDQVAMPVPPEPEPEPEPEPDPEDRVDEPPTPEP